MIIAYDPLHALVANFCPVTFVSFFVCLFYVRVGRGLGSLLRRDPTSPRAILDTLKTTGTSASAIGGSILFPPRLPRAWEDRALEWQISPQLHTRLGSANVDARPTRDWKTVC